MAGYDAPERRKQADVNEVQGQGSKTWMIAGITAVVTALVVGVVMYLAIGGSDGSTEDELAAANTKVDQQAAQIDDLTAQVEDLQKELETRTSQLKHQKTQHQKAEEQLAAETSSDLADGRYPVLVEAVDPTSGSESVTVDVIQFYTGDAANQASAEDGGEVPVPNDVYTRNESKKLRTLPVVPGISATVGYWQKDTMANPPDGKKVSFSQFAQAINGNASWQQMAQGSIYWITLNGGEVTKIEYQYMP